MLQYMLLPRHCGTSKLVKVRTVLERYTSYKTTGLLVVCVDDGHSLGILNGRALRTLKRIFLREVIKSTRVTMGSNRGNTASFMCLVRIRGDAVCKLVSIKIWLLAQSLKLFLRP